MYNFTPLQSVNNIFHTKTIPASGQSWFPNLLPNRRFFSAPTFDALIRLEDNTFHQNWIDLRSDILSDNIKTDIFLGIIPIWNYFLSTWNKIWPFDTFVQQLSQHIWPGIAAIGSLVAFAIFVGVEANSGCNLVPESAASKKVVQIFGRQLQSS